MEKHNRFLGIPALCLALTTVFLWVGPAAASFRLTVDVFKQKDVDVEVDTVVNKTIILNVTVEEEYEGSAQAMALANVDNTVNTVGPCLESCENGFDPDSFGIELSALIDTSVNSNEGIVGINQDVGNMVNQSNILSFARVEFASATEEGPAQFASSAESVVDQLNQLNTVTQEEIFDEPLFSNPDHDATISGSINDNNGIVGVNQNAGNMNNQTNAVAIVVGEGNAVVLTEAVLGQENSDNIVVGVETVKVNMITASVNGNNGVISVNQSVGNMNNQGSSIAFGALKTTATIGVPGS